MTAAGALATIVSHGRSRQSEAVHWRQEQTQTLRTSFKRHLRARCRGPCAPNGKLGMGFIEALREGGEGQPGGKVGSNQVWED